MSLGDGALFPSEIPEIFYNTISDGEEGEFLEKFSLK